MNDKKINMKTQFMVAGAFISYTIGAGFASGNEILQFFGSWGVPGVFVAIFGGVLLNVIFCICLYTAAQNADLDMSAGIYTFFSGKVMGWFFKIFVYIFIIGCYMLMFSGAGSLLNQSFGIPQWVGAVILGIVAAIVVLGGLKTVENVLGYAGIVILAYVLIFGIISLFHPATDFGQANDIIPAVADGKIWQANLFELPPLGWIPGLAGLNNAFVTGLLYGGVCMITGFPFYFSLGRQMKSKLDATMGGVMTSVAFYACIGFCLMILLSNFDSLIDPATGKMFPFPTLAGVDHMWHAGSWTYVIVIFVGIFTTVAGYTWVITDAIFPGEEKTNRIRITICILLVIGITLGSVLPFSQVINFLYPLSGIAGVLLTVFVLVRTLMLSSKKSGSDNA